MIRNRKNLLSIFILFTAVLFLLISCSNIPLIGKKKEDKAEKLSAGKTVTVEGMETAKGVNPPKSEAPPAKKPATQPTLPKKEDETKVASIPTRPFYSPTLPFFQLGFKRKVAILDFENKTTYKMKKSERQWRRNYPINWRLPSEW